MEGNKEILVYLCQDNKERNMEISVYLYVVTRKSPENDDTNELYYRFFFVKLSEQFQDNGLKTSVRNECFST